MIGNRAERRMVLCAGLQSGGTTLVSWCFLQRQDTNGVLDMDNAIIQTCFAQVVEPIVWVKMTVGAFQWLDVSEVYRDLGWEPEPLLVVRDVRAAFASLMRKDYGFNGASAETPPLRLRFRRYLRDWELFQTNGWPILKYEDLIEDEQGTLRRICNAMRLTWDDGMLSWPKKLSEIAYAGETNETFMRSVDKGSFAQAKLREKTRIAIDSLPGPELEWLERTFEAYNRIHSYPDHIPHPRLDAWRDAAFLPRADGTERLRCLSEINELGAELARMQIAALVPPGETFIAVDGEYWADTHVPGVRRIPFLERNSEYWGLPPDDETAIREVERLRQSGASFLMFAWPAFWWLDYYTTFHDHLRGTYRCILRNNRFVVFDLRCCDAAARQVPLVS